MILSRRDTKQRIIAMKKTTCAACDCELGPDVISVKLGGKTVEVCCQECAEALKEADAAATTARASNNE
ncbi:hypothetical protein A6U87_04380 [Rhizobium sp. AC44/96]|jgi:RNase P subunit RPR2|nr:hypothetical protein A6U87_04380 [Rhizobium sp. AC44/96]